MSIWVFDHVDTRRMTPSNIVDVLKDKGFTNVVDKGKLEKGDFNHGRAYFAPKMSKGYDAELLKEVKQVTATRPYIIWESLYEPYTGSSVSFIKDEMGAYFKNGTVDIILIF